MVSVDVLKERAVKAPEIKTEYDLPLLLKAITTDNIHEAIDFGAAVGQEFGAEGHNPSQPAAGGRSKSTPSRTGGSTGKAPPG